MSRRRSKKISTPVAQLRKIGVVPREMDPAQRADLYWRSAHRFIPKVVLWIKVCCGVALLGALACLFVVFSRPRPMLLVSFPDGTTLCSMPPLDPDTGAIIPRPSAEDAACKSLSFRAGRADDEQNVAFVRENRAKTNALPPTTLDSAPSVQSTDTPPVSPPASPPATTVQEE